MAPASLWLVPSEASTQGMSRRKSGKKRGMREPQRYIPLEGYKDFQGPDAVAVSETRTNKHKEAYTSAQSKSHNRTSLCYIINYSYKLLNKFICLMISHHTAADPTKKAP